MATPARRRFAFFGVLGLLSITVEVSPPVAAQAPLLPHAAIRTLPNTFGEVWPGDFNEDGITDLASGSDDVMDPRNRDVPIQVALGNGDGTFRAPILTTILGLVRAVADMNRDGFVDVIADTPEGLQILPGNGNGTLQAPRLVTATGGFAPFVLAVDLDGDALRDVALVEREGATAYLAIYPGRGDFTFREPALLPLGIHPRQATTGDFDGDGRLDIAVAHVVYTSSPSSGRVTVYMNAGMLQFTPTTITLPKPAFDLTTRDLNGDGARDMVVSASTNPDRDYAWDGFVYVLMGDGNGTFALAGTFPTGISPVAIVLGDFTHDGRLDVATANRSARTLDDGCVFMAGADSVSILPGSGHGTFGAPTTFALGSQKPSADLAADFFGRDVDSLNTSDLDRDGYPDLITSDGKLLITAAPRANRAPVVNAGPDESQPAADTIWLSGGGTDADGHLLSFRTRDASGKIDHPSNVGCLYYVGAERHELTMTATDGWAQGSDTVVYDFRFTDPGPEGWTNGDIGKVAAAGSSVFNSYTNEFTVTGSGTDIWYRADEFHFVRTSVTGDFSIYASVPSVENVNRWTKAGLMLREGTAAGARHASVFVTPTTEKGVAFQRRRTVNGLSEHTAGPALTAPVSLLLKRTGDLISAYYGTDTQGWTLIGRVTLSGLAATLDVGLAVSSHLDGALATARFRDVQLLGPRWGQFASDIGAVGLPGTGSIYMSGNSTAGDMHGSGADIWGTADAFYFLREWWTAGGTATVRVQSLQHTHRWAKFGLMFRENDEPGSRHVMLIVSAAMGVAMQYRAQPGGVSSNVAITTGSAPEWLRLRRAGNTFTGYASEDGATWRTIGSITLPLDLDTFVGVAITSHNNSTRALGVFDNMTLVRE